MKKNYIFAVLIVAILFTTHSFSQVNVTLKVDMSSETVSADGVHIAGSLNGWDSSGTMLTQEGTSDIYTVTLQLNTGWYEYKFLNGNAWGTEENAGYPCAPSNGNRFVYINDSGNDVILEVVPFSDCNADGTGFSFTLNVDMSSETVSADGVKIAGWLNGWNGDNLVAPDVSGNIYSATLRLPTPADYPIVLEYKYLNGGNWESPDAGCDSVTNDNRVVTIAKSGDNIYDVFNGCTYTLSLNDNLLNDIQTFYKKNEGLVINSQKNHSNLNVELFNLLGGKIFSKTLSNLNKSARTIKLNNINIGVYIIRITDDSNRIFSQKILID